MEKAGRSLAEGRYVHAIDNNPDPDPNPIPADPIEAEAKAKARAKPQPPPRAKGYRPGRTTAKRRSRTRWAEPTGPDAGLSSRVPGLLFINDCSYFHESATQTSDRARPAPSGPPEASQ